MPKRPGGEIIQFISCNASESALHRGQTEIRSFLNDRVHASAHRRKAVAPNFCVRLIESETGTRLLDTNNDSTDGLAVRLVVSELQVVVAVVVHVDVEITLLRVV